ncbi:MAG: cytochrome c [Mesorhizobium sp.]
MRMRRWIAALASAAVIGVGAFWYLTIPERLPEAEIAALAPGDPINGEKMFRAGGCASCHAGPNAEADGDLPRLAGGVELSTPFGVFVAPNISQHGTDGIGSWTLSDFANAMQKGVSPSGQHLYPAFPYTSYARMKLTDVSDLYAYMKTLPAIEGAAADHRLGFPFTLRRGLGLWKLANLSPEPVADLANASPQVLAGQYLVEGPGHCGECHTPRNWTGGTDKSQWLAGAVAAEGEGRVPNITPEGRDVSGWSEDEIAEYLASGFTPEFDSAGGSMADVVKNMSKLTSDDRLAIAAYLKAIPGHANGYPAR